MGNVILKKYDYYGIGSMKKVKYWDLNPKTLYI